jgi:hypothetical protein
LCSLTPEWGSSGIEKLALAWTMPSSIQMRARRDGLARRRKGIVAAARDHRLDFSLYWVGLRGLYAAVPTIFRFTPSAIFDPSARTPL